jgi:hypothetical protein
MDLDIRKCFPSMLMQTCKDAGILKTPKLTQYTTNGDALIREILLSELKKQEEKQEEGQPQRGKSVFSLVYEDVKKAFLVSLHCGDYKYKATEGRALQPLDDFATEIRRVATQLYSLAAYKAVRDHVEAHKTESENRLGSFISLICQDMESRVIEAAREYLYGEGFDVRVNMYDGLMLDVEAKNEKRCDAACLGRLEEYVFETTGCRVKFVQKPIKRYTVEQVCVPPAVTAPTPGDYTDRHSRTVWSRGHTADTHRVSSTRRKGTTAFVTSRKGRRDQDRVVHTRA